MLLLEFPAELLHKILYYAVIARGVKRGLRLRLVCKQFSEEVHPVLFKTQLLDSFDLRNTLIDCYINSGCKTSTFWHSYLVYSVRKANRHSRRRFRHILRIAEKVCEETDLELMTTIEALCWPALRKGCDGIEDKLGSPWADEEPFISRHNLLCAAAHLNQIPLARRLLEGICDPGPTGESWPFQSPLRLAARAGNIQMLKLLETYVLKQEEGGVEGGVDQDIGFSLIRKDWILGAAERGDQHLLSIALRPPSLTGTDPNGIFQSLGNGWITKGLTMILARRSAGSLEVYKAIEKVRAGVDTQLTYELRIHSRLGHFEIVQYLLSVGTKVRIPTRSDNEPLTKACRKGHERIVDLLLRYGDDTSRYNPQGHGKDTRSKYKAIREAATWGGLAIVQKFLDYGLDLRRTDEKYIYYALVDAIRAEHTALVRLLLTSGIDVTICGGVALKLAIDEGLHSMAELLRSEGATLDREKDPAMEICWSKESGYSLYSKNGIS